HQICKAMDDRGIWYMRLKGSVLKDLYPRMEMRQMTDQDILFDTTRREDMREFMLARGYDPKGHSDTHHDIYHRDPCYNFELHHTLFELHCDLRLVNYYRNVKEERMLPNNDGTMGFHFSDEDFYIYMIAHAYKHYTDHGVGLRSLVDVYVFDSQKPDLDWAYVEGECQKLGMYEYERTCRFAARKLLRDNAPETLTEAEIGMVRFCTASGTHGNEEGYIHHELRSGGGKVTFWQKVKYLWKRLFPSAKWMRENERLVRRHPWLLPVGWITRLFRGIFKKGGHTTSEFRYVMNTEEVE
ncbi:MAG: nucleotidyltransferase family protein, partial [Oscillospiraceae bacterium]|nr:nucleotidyltransferase family protein [Oscillospiraceae bacterium]